MRRESFQRAARAAFSEDDWLVLMEDPSLREWFACLRSTEDIERFVFNGYDQLKSQREQPGSKAPLSGAL
jgi:hypothetical protein